MRLQYYPEKDPLYIDFGGGDGAVVREISEGVIADFDEDGRIVGTDIQHASTALDLRTLEAVALPLTQATPA